MIQLTNACVSAVDDSRGNSSNLLFSGQILPERNAGLNGAPSLKLDPGAACVAAVFDGVGDGAGKAAYAAASAFRGADSLRTLEDLEVLFAHIHADLCAASDGREGDPLTTSAAAACVDGDRLALACLGGCRVYLMRDRALYLLSRPGADAAPNAAPPAPDDGPRLGLEDAAESAARPFTLRGTLLPGDQLLLCTGWLPAALDAREMLRVMADADTPSAALQQLARRAGAGRGDVAAVLLKAEAAAEAEAPEQAAETAETAETVELEDTAAPEDTAEAEADDAE